MPIHFYCPLGHRLAVPDERAGKKGRCPVCQQRVIVPVADPVPSSRARPTGPIKIPSPESILEELVAEQLGLAAKNKATPPGP